MLEANICCLALQLIPQGRWHVTLLKCDMDGRVFERWDCGAEQPRARSRVTQCISKDGFAARAQFWYMSTQPQGKCSCRRQYLLLPRLQAGSPSAHEKISSVRTHTVFRRAAPKVVLPILLCWPMRGGCQWYGNRD